MGNVKIISASAGSGKTYRLAYQYVSSVIASPETYRRILAVTFTNKATEEMRGRILERLHELADESNPAPEYLPALLKDFPNLDERKIRARAREAQHAILHDFSHFAVLTIDRFFQRLIRGFIRELGVEVNFNIELETESLLSQAADALVDESAGDEKLRRRLMLAARKQLDEGKRWSIKEALVDLGGELFGSDWRRAPEDAETIIDAVVKRAAAARERLKATAWKMQQLIDTLGLTADDFRGRSKGLTLYLSRVAGGGFLPLSNYARQELEGGTLDPRLKELLSEMDEEYGAGIRLVNSAELLRENHHNFLLLTDLQERIERLCKEQNILPIAETNRLIRRLVAGNDAPFIYEKTGGVFSHFFIDEFQDTSTVQWENFVPLLRNAIAGERGEPVMLIGDVKQAIYRWRGGDWQILSRRVAEEMGAERVSTETLERNYRSARRVVEFNNRAISLLVEVSENEALRDAYTAHEQSPKSDVDEGYVTLTTYEANEAGEWIPPVVSRVADLLSRGFAPRDIAVLVRTNTQASRVAQMLLAAGYQVVTQEALAVGAAAVSRFVIACLTLAADPSDDISRAIYNGWLGRDFGAELAGGGGSLAVDRDAKPAANNDAAFFTRIGGLSPEEAFEEIVLRFDLQNRPSDIAYIQALHQQITTFSARSVGDIGLFLRWWDERGAAASIALGEGGEAITVSTIHKAKGLEYQAVIVPYLSWPLGPETQGRSLVVWDEGDDQSLAGLGPVPLNFKKEMAESFFSAAYRREQTLAHIDAVNLFYVAITRARQELHLMNSANPKQAKNSVGSVLVGLLGAPYEYGVAKHFGVGQTGASGGHQPSAADGFGLTSFGEARDNAEQTSTRVLTSYPTSRPGARVRMRLSEARRSGLSMHAALEGALTFDDVCRVLGRVPTDGRVKGWFDGEWDEVRRESGIIVAGGAGGRRPDRVMIHGQRAIVVDYKFGAVRRRDYARQLQNYSLLLGRMGYAPVEAYIWYVELDAVEEVR